MFHRNAEGIHVFIKCAVKTSQMIGLSDYKKCLECGLKKQYGTAPWYYFYQEERISNKILTQ